MLYLSLTENRLYVCGWVVQHTLQLFSILCFKMWLCFEDMQRLWQVRNSVLLSLNDFGYPIVTGGLVLLLVASVLLDDVKSFGVGRDVGRLVIRFKVPLLSIDYFRLVQIFAVFFPIV